MNQSFTSKDHEKTLHYLNEMKDSGYLIGLDCESLTIKFVSENICDIIDGKYSLDQIVGSKLEYFFPFDLDFDLLKDQSIGECEKKFVISNEKKYFLIYYRFQDYYYIELEEDNNTNSQFYTENFTERIIFSRTKDENWENLVDAIKKITQFNGVMIYKFSDNQEAKVISERFDHGIEDIVTAEDVCSLVNDKEFLLAKNISYVSNLNDSTIKIISEDDQKIDLIFSEFAPIPKVYFKKLNQINVNSFFSVPIVVNHKLWGMLVCVNTQPKSIQLSKRLQCVRLARFARVSFVNFKYEEKTKFRHRFNNLLNSVKDNLLNENGYDKLSSNLSGMLNIANADGIAFVNNGQVLTYGNVPSNEEIKSIKRWFLNEEFKDVYFSDSFYLDYGKTLDLTPNSAAIAGKILDTGKRTLLIWFKKDSSPQEYSLGQDQPLKFEVKDYSTSTKRIVIRREIKTVHRSFWKKREIEIIHDILHHISKTTNVKSFKIAELQTQLQEVNHELNSFSHSISHDLRTPLAVMRLNCQMLQKSLESQNLNYDRIDNVIAEIDNVTEMMQEILNFSKAKNSDLFLQEVDCEQLLDKVIKDSIIYNNVGQIDVVLGKLYPVFSDKTMAYEIFSNLINNAIKYTSKTESPKLEISSSIMNNQVVYKFKDNGIGIKESDREKMFKMFSRMSNSSGFKGNGVGLYIVNRMMQRLEGSIDFNSEENIGTEFILKFNVPK